MLLKRCMALSVREVFDDGADEDVPEASPVRQDVLDESWRSGK
jgi:hypothetical protein